MSSLTNKVVLITGASSGIGAGTAIHFAGLGCRLVLNGRNEQNLKKTAQECVRAGASQEKIFEVVCPLDEEANCKLLIDEAVKHFGQLDVLVNNAGILVTGGIETVSLNEYDQQMNVNVRSLYILTKLAVPQLLKTKGNIVNVSSVAGLRSFPGIVAYATSKAAVDQMTKCVALEVAARGVRVNAVNPGVIITEVHKRSGMSEEEYSKFLEKGKETHALGRPGTVDEVAKAIAFLASEDASFITGATLPVDGGRHAMCPR